MNSLIGFLFIILAALSQFGVVHFQDETMAVQLFCLVMAGIFFLRQEVKELRENCAKTK